MKILEHLIRINPLLTNTGLTALRRDSLFTDASVIKLAGKWCDLVLCHITGNFQYGIAELYGQ